MSKIEEAKQILEALGLPKRQQNDRSVEMEEMLKKCEAGKIYVSAFPDFKEFKRHTSDIAWEAEVWVVNFPDHMIHFNGDKFIGPR